jgi:hypothetical protein
VDGPKFNEVVTVYGYSWGGIKAKQGCVLISEYIAPKHTNLAGKPVPPTFGEHHFEPLVSDAVLREELLSVPEPFTI